MSRLPGSQSQVIHGSNGSASSRGSQYAQAAAGSFRPRFQHAFDSTLGWIAFQGTDRGMTALTFGHSSRQDAVDRLRFESSWRFPNLESDQLASAAPALEDPQPEWVLQAEQLLRAYADGEPVDLSTIPCDVPAKTRFEERVREQLAHVGYGRTITYGQLAEAAGAPRAARAVGSVMSRNPIPLVIACHRVLASNGKLGGYSAPTGLEMKERLLQLERTGLAQPLRS